MMKDQISIDKRPAIVEEKQRFGDVETDTTIGKNYKGAIVTINGSGTGMVKIKKIRLKKPKRLKK